MEHDALWAAIDRIRNGGGKEACEEFGKIVRKWQGNASALDVEMASATEALLDFASTRLVRAETTEKPYADDGLDAACGAVYELCLARGVKAALRVFPHSVQDLEAVDLTLRLLGDVGAWRTRYTLLLWLAMLAKNPFDVESAVVGGRDTFVRSATRVCEKSFRDSGPTREAAALCLSSVLTRRDVSPKELEGLIQRFGDLVRDVGRGGGRHDTIFAAHGTGRAVANALKTGQRERSRNLARATLDAVALCFDDGENQKLLRPLRRLAVKIVGRCGCALLKPRVAAWCYARGRRTLLVDQQQGARQESVKMTPTVLEEDEEDRLDAEGDEDAGELLEQVVDWLLEGYRDGETSTRWTAAKAIGRISARLGQAVADDVVACVLEDATDSDDDAARHGACLALAELARLGVLLPARLPEAMNALNRSMIFDKRTASGSVGAHVRDAACYVAWAFARAYDPSVISPYMNDLVSSVIVVSLFDREIHVRRAASAALQENIGRQGHANVPNGIELLSLADYFALGSRDRAYLDVAPAVFRLSPDYADSILECLLNDRLQHWDASVRQLSSKALGALIEKGTDVECERDRLVKTALDELSPRCLSTRDVGERQGALLGIAEAILAARSKTLPYETVAAIVPEIDAKRLYRGRGGELVRVAACRLVECISRCGATLAVKTQLSLLDTLDECAVHAVEDVRDAAVDALRQFTATYFGVGSQPASARLIDRTLNKYVDKVESATTASVSRGMVRCVGALPKRIVSANVDRAIESLCKRAHRDNKISGERDAETRRDAIRALSEICETAFDEEGNLPSLRKSSRIARVFETYVEACRDYGVDKRGDVGSWARMEAMRAATALAVIASRAAYPARPALESVQAVPDLETRLANFPTIMEKVPVSPTLEDDRCCWTPSMAHSLVDVILRQLGEKLDVVSSEAETLLRKIVCTESVAIVPSKKAIKDAIVVSEGSNGGRQHTFTGLTRVIATASTYTLSCVGGLVVTAGSADSKTSDAARKELISNANDWARNKHYSHVARLARALITMLEQICLSKKPKVDDDDESVHRALATAATLSKEESTRAYVPLARVTAAILDSPAMRAIIEPKEKPALADDIGDAKQAINQDRVNPDDDESLLSVLVATLARVAASRRCTSDVRRTCAVSDALLAAVSLCVPTAPGNARKATASLVASLASPMPRARAHVAEQLFGRLVELGLGDQTAFTLEQLGAAQGTIGDAVWDDDTPIFHLRERQALLADQLGIREQVDRVTAVIDKRSRASAPQKDELESYASLVKDAGF